MSLPITQAAIELGIAVGDYNSGITKTYTEITRITLEYILAVKDAVANKQVDMKDLRDYFALVGQSWAAIDPRETEKKEGPSTAEKPT
jgi:5-methylthioribose kinase